MAAIYNYSFRTDIKEILEEVEQRTALKSRAIGDVAFDIVAVTSDEYGQIFSFLKEGSAVLGDYLGWEYVPEESGIDVLTKNPEALKNTPYVTATYNFPRWKPVGFTESKWGLVQELIKKALIHYILWHWYRGCRLFDDAAMEEREYEKAAYNVRFNTFEKNENKSAKTPYRIF
jgi:hypothetical protein